MRLKLIPIHRGEYIPWNATHAWAYGIAKVEAERRYQEVLNTIKNKPAYLASNYYGYAPSAPDFKEKGKRFDGLVLCSYETWAIVMEDGPEHNEWGEVAP